MISPQVAKEVGSRLGEVEEVEWGKRKDDINFFMRVRVALPIMKPLRRGGFIASSEGERYWVSFKYERLPMFCHFYGILGHGLKHCATNYAAEKNGGSMEYQYRDFLKAVRGRAKVVPSQHIGPKSSQEEGAGNDSANTPILTVDDLMKMAVVTALGPKKPRSVDKDDPVNLVKEITRMDSVDFVHQANVEEDNSSEAKVRLEITLTDNEIDELHKSFGDDISYSITDEGITNCMTNGVQRHMPLNDTKTMGEPGPSFVKPKNTWTRINRMDFGLGGLARAITLPVLGKRELKDGEVGQYEERNTKRGKIVEEEGNIVDISAGVDSHPCREQ